MNCDRTRWFATKSWAEILAVVAAAGVFAVVVAALLPGRVIVRGDDFGYVESAAETIRRGHWTASDWLEPFNLLLPFLSAGVQASTGNFWLATLGVAGGLALGNFALLRVWLRGAGGWVVVLAVALSPVWLNKATEFTGVPLGLALTLAALIAWRGGSWVAFFILVMLGFTNRQNAICLLALPAWRVLQTWRRERRMEVGLMMGMVFAASALAVLALALPVTFARELTAARWRDAFSWRSLVGNLVLAIVILAALRAGWAALRGELSVAEWRENLANPLGPLALTAAGSWVVLSGSAQLHCETPGMDPWSLAFLAGAIVFGAWCGRWHAGAAGEALACVATYAVLVSLRGTWWDYYFLEPALVLAWPPSPQRPGVVRPSRWPRWVLLVAGLGYAVLLGDYLRRAEAKTVAYEQALRVGELSIVEASDAPFGYLGWKLFRLSKARGAAGARLIDFGKYVEGGRGRWRDGLLVVDREGGRRSLFPSGEKWVLPPDYRDRRFPLTNAEWREFLQSDAQ